MVPIRTRWIGAVAFALAACGSAGGDEATVPSAPIVATTTIWADVTSAVLCGEPVPAIVPAGADPHSFEPSLQTRASISDTTTIIANGNDLEESLADLLATTADGGTAVVELTKEIDLLDDGGDGDPHIWQDPTRVAAVLDVIAAAGEAAGFETCADDYREQLDALDREIERLLSDLPADDRVMVTNHDSLAYFADRYDLDVIGTVIPASSTLAQTNAAELATLADAIEERGVRAIFTEELSSAADAEALADRLGVAVVPLVTDALTDDPDSDTYVEMMRSNARLIARTLAP